MNTEFKIKIDGIPDPILSADVVEIVVDTSIYISGHFKADIIINEYNLNRVFCKIIIANNFVHKYY